MGSAGVNAQPNVGFAFSGDLLGNSLPKRSFEVFN